MNAKICDRCGEFYRREKDKWDDVIDIGDLQVVNVMFEARNDNNGFIHHYVDLCPKYMNELKWFFDNAKKPVETKKELPQWILQSDGRYKCSNCSSILREPYKKCKVCGTEMQRYTEKVDIQFERTERPAFVGDSFDVVDAFMHLIWGRKVRQTTWPTSEYIHLVHCEGDTYVTSIKDESGRVIDDRLLYSKSAIEAKWEDYNDKR